VYLGCSRLARHVPPPPRLCFRPVRSLRFVSTPQLELCWSLPLPYLIQADLGMAKFPLLPEELIEHIISCLDQAGLYSACQLNKALHRIAIPFLHRHVDLRILPDKTPPRIDRFCLAVLNDVRLASCVKTLQIGLLPNAESRRHFSSLPCDSSFDDHAMSIRAMDILGSDPLMWTDTTQVSLQIAIEQPILHREYGAYATLVLLVLPNLHEVNFTDRPRMASAPFHSVFQIISSPLFGGRDFPLQRLCNRLSSIMTVSYNFNQTSGVHHPDDQRVVDLDSVLNLPSIKKLEFSINEKQATRSMDTLVRNIRASTITVLVIRHSTPVLEYISLLLACTPQLGSFTYDIFWDKHESGAAPTRWIDLDEWNSALRTVKDTLVSLAFAVEYCDTGSIPCDQPRIGDKIHGYLDLADFNQMKRLEIPIPFLTGDVEFSITADIYPHLPPYLQDLSLRPDMSYAQFSYQRDPSILSRDITRVEATAEARFAMSARMDNSYMFYATLTLLDCAPKLKTIAVWQPADPSLSWFPNQIEDFATTCKNKSLAGFLLMPMLHRLRKPEQQDLVKEITVFDPSNPGCERGERLYSGERAGVPLGLATQYHLHASNFHCCSGYDYQTLTIISAQDPTMRQSS
jgi:hypothetical protein